MTDSYRLTILKALTTHLEGVSKSDGYNYDLRGCVFRGRGRFGDADPETMISILENPRPDQGNFVGDRATLSEYWPLLLQGWCPDDPKHPSDPMYGLLDDVERRLARLVAEDPRSGFPIYPSEYLLGKKIIGMELGRGVVRPPTDGVSSRCFMYLPLAIGLAVTLA